MSKLLLVTLIATLAWATPYKFSQKPLNMIVGDEVFNVVHNPSGPGFSPGDSAGWTMYDYQRNGQTGWQVWYDGAQGIHVDFMVAHVPNPDPNRGCAYNFKLGGVWYGSVSVNSERAGYVTAGYKPSNNAGVCGYHMTKSGDIYRAWLAVDADQGAYSFTEYPVMPQQTTNEYIWPRLAIDDQDNFHVVVHDHISNTAGNGFYSRSTDGGTTWSDEMVMNPTTDELVDISQGVFADRFNTAGKVMLYWTDWTGSNHTQMDEDIYYMISTDYGATWGSQTNITNYSGAGRRAYTHVKGIFDGSGDPHIVFPNREFDGTNYYAKSWIVHWSPATGFTDVTGPHSMSNSPGNWRLPSDEPSIAVDKDNGNLYCVYVLNRDSDMSAGGYPNGELMALASTDNGATWGSNAVGDTGVNLTMTPTPGAPAGQCCDDDYPSMHPYVENIGGIKSLVIEYIEDKDAGGFPQGEGTETNNPVRVYVVPTSRINVAEQEPGIPKRTELKVYPNPAHGLTRVSYALANEAKVRIRVMDITGRVVNNLVDQVMGAGYHTAFFRGNVPAGVYFVQMETGNYRATESVILVR